MLKGTGRVFSEIGVPAAGVEAGFANGFMYTRMRPLIGADRPRTTLPPLVLLKLVTRLHPEFRRRERRAKASLSARPAPALAVVQQWESEIRPRLLERNRALQAVDLDTLSDNDLEQHLGALLDHALENFTLHFWLHGHDLGPIARYLHSAIGWGLDPVEAIDALAGASPSTSLPRESLLELRRLVDESDHPVRSLEDLRSSSDEAAGLLDRYLADRAMVMTTGYDLTSLTLGELPDVVMRSILSAVGGKAVEADDIAAGLSTKVEPAMRAEFDELLHDARSVMDMRDDNGPMTSEWPAGLLRHGLLAAGQRLAAQGYADEPEQVFELTEAEARSLFSGVRPSAGELASRRERRLLNARLTPPVVLGDPEPAPPDDMLPPSQAKLVAMVQTSLKFLGMDGEGTTEGMTGVGVGSESYIGRARTAFSAEEAIDKLEDGDVLIVRATSPAFNSVLAIAGAVVTTDGGLLSHAAVLARELGIPALVGVSGALDIEDGASVEVDPVAGTIRVLA